MVITEKLDGNNFRTMIHESGELVFGSRNVKFTESGDYNEGSVPLPPDKIGGQLDAVSNYLTEQIDTDELQSIEEEFDSQLVLFGENMVPHSLDYDWDDVPQWLMFGVYHVEDDRYLPFEDVQRIADRLGLTTVPKVDELPAEEFKDQFDPDDPDAVVPESEYRDGTAEGIVLHNEDNGVKAKVHSEEFKEVHKQSGGEHGQESLPGDETAELVNKYATDGRIEKHIQKLTVDEDRDLEMELMEELPMRVVEDIFQEEHEEIVRTNKTVDFKDFRSKVAKKCVTMLRSKMREASVA